MGGFRAGGLRGERMRTYRTLRKAPSASTPAPGATHMAPRPRPKDRTVTCWIYAARRSLGWAGRIRPQIAGTLAEPSTCLSMA